MPHLVIRFDVPPSGELETTGNGTSPSDAAMVEELAAREAVLEAVSPYLASLPDRPPHRSGNVSAVELLGQDTWSALNHYLLILHVDIGTPQLDGLPPLLPEGSTVQPIGDYQPLRCWPDPVSSDSAFALVRRFIQDGWNGADQQSAADLVAPDYDSTDGGFFRTDVPSGLERLHGAEAFHAHLELYAKKYADLHFAIDRMIPDGDAVLTVSTVSGTIIGEVFTNRAGQLRHRELGGQVISRTEVTDGLITRHDLFW
ncbi:MAG TPA: nuclear transport factor 2 family protein [Kineosporiaceae bacterium]|nr:nuclear transport factor 2 family protein [Kineosporiaceae bacterium]